MIKGPILYTDRQGRSGQSLVQYDPPTQILIVWSTQSRDPRFRGPEQDMEWFISQVHSQMGWGHPVVILNDHMAVCHLALINYTYDRREDGLYLKDIIFQGFETVEISEVIQWMNPTQKSKLQE